MIPLTSGHAICARENRALERNNIYCFSMGSIAQDVLIKLSSYFWETLRIFKKSFGEKYEKG